MNDLKAEFKRWARAGYLGDPIGENSYGYGRASSERQVEEGSSFPRQMENIHKTALRDGLRIPFDMLFFDDGYTGFDFEHRPSLLKLRHEVATRSQAHHLIIEEIDRLSRNADWQQGFLLEEFARHKIEVHFFINPGSQLERYVRGYIAQEGMTKDIERMRMGSVYKAMDGRVTARRPRYGYVITDPKDSHYELHPEESKIVRAVYERLIYQGWTTKMLAKWLNDTHIPTRFQNGVWDASTICRLIKSPVYKGEFYANCFLQMKTGRFTAQGRAARTTKKRPPEEWIKVVVPAIVTPEEWDLAQECLQRNSKRSLRNGKMRGWLLQGILKCGLCKKYVFRAIIKKGARSIKEHRYYVCNSRYAEKTRVEGNRCLTPYVRADDLERKVWEKIEEVIYDPTAIIQRLEDKTNEQQAMGLQGQIDYINSQLADLDKERSKYEAAYNRDIYTLDEFEEKMKDVRARVQTLELSRSKLQAKLSETHSIEEQTTVVLAALQRLREEVEKAKREQRLPDDIPFELKRKILTSLVDTIWVNSVDRTFTIDGEIKGTYAIDDTLDTPKSGNPGKGNGGIGKTSVAGRTRPTAAPASRPAPHAGDSPSRRRRARSHVVSTYAAGETQPDHQVAVTRELFGRTDAGSVRRGRFLFVGGGAGEKPERK